MSGTHLCWFPLALADWQGQLLLVEVICVLFGEHHTSTPPLLEILYLHFLDAGEYVFWLTVYISSISSYESRKIYAFLGYLLWEGNTLGQDNAQANCLEFNGTIP